MLNPSIKDIPMPENIRALPVDERGFPVPYFVEWIEDRPEFRAMRAEAFRSCVKHRLCWICGQPMGRFMVFNLGPMCAVNRVNSEPPSHLECARYAAKACPFLARPHMTRREDGLPESFLTTHAAGCPIERNPGVVGLWVTRSYKPFSVPRGVQGANSGVLFQLGNPEHVEWYAQGREATRAEVWHSIETGLPILREAAEKDGPQAMHELENYITRVMPLLPPEKDGGSAD